MKLNKSTGKSWFMAFFTHNHFPTQLRHLIDRLFNMWIMWKLFVFALNWIRTTILMLNHKVYFKYPHNAMRHFLSSRICVNILKSSYDGCRGMFSWDKRACTCVYDRCVWACTLCKICRENSIYEQIIEKCGFDWEIVSYWH